MQESPYPSDPTSSTGARLFIGRLLETFFRRWWIYAIPVVLLTALGAATVVGRAASYRSSGIILVNRDSQLNQLTAARGQNQLAFETIATYTSRQFNTLLGTDAFLKAVIKDAGLTSAVESGVITEQEIRGSLWAYARGDELVVINAATDNPELSYRLAGATIDGYLQWEIDNTVSQSQSTEEFFQGLLVPYQQRVDEASDALSSYVKAHPAAGQNGVRPADEQVEISALTQAVNNANAQLDTARSSLAAARLASAQTSTDVAQRLRVVDAPEQPIAPEPHRRKDALTLMFFMTLGALVSAAALVVATLLDRSVRYADEIETHLHLPVLATVPSSRGPVRTRVL